MTAAKEILIVDDDARVVAFLDDCFQRSGRAYAVRTSSTGTDALEAVHQRRPDLVLLDITLPDVSGLHVLKLIRQLDPAIPVIMITGTRDPRSAVEAIESGAFAYIPKPFNVSYIENLVAAALKAGA
jgi:DNA-binding NtrC family response regulator